MIFHASIPADEPRRTAEAIATLWGGRAYPCPMLTPGSWVALAGDDRGSIIVSPDRTCPRQTATGQVTAAIDCAPDAGEIAGERAFAPFVLWIPNVSVGWVL